MHRHLEHTPYTVINNAIKLVESLELKPLRYYKQLKEVITLKHCDPSTKHNALECKCTRVIMKAILNKAVVVARYVFLT